MIHPDIPKSEQVMAFTHLGCDCTVLMGPFTINGYIVLPEGHPWLQHESLEGVDFIDVHGGITYHQGRVIGFDTNHSGDGHHPDSAGYQCAIEHGLNIPRGIPWSWEEVAEETERLAEQAREAAYYDTYLQITQEPGGDE